MNEGTPRTDAFLSAPASDIFAHACQLERELRTLQLAAGKVCHAFTYNPGHSDLDDEQPIHITVPLGDWRRLDLALRSV
jgi:hypothetical protein